MAEKGKEKKYRVTNCHVDRFRRSNARATRGEKFNRFGSIVVATIREIPPPVKFCRVNHNVTSIHPRDRD